MKKFFILLTTVSSLLLFSCTKEKSIDGTDPDAPVNGGGSGGNTGNGGGVVQTGSLMNRIATYGSPDDSSITLYAYNTAKQFISKKIQGGYDAFGEEDITITRNASGVITKVLFEDKLSGLNDSREYIIYQKDGRYSARVHRTDMGSGMSQVDSSVFVYDASGKIIREDVHTGTSLLGQMVYVQLGKLEFTYTSNNLTKVIIYGVDPGNIANITLKPIGEIALEYDNKDNPLKLANEAFLTEMYQYASINNISRLTYKDLSGFGDDDLVTLSYTYNSNSRPLTADFASQSGDSFRLMYYYQ